MFQENIVSKKLKIFSSKTITIKSNALKGNPLQDPYERQNFCLLPKKEGAYNCVFYLSGLTSDGIKAFNFKPFQKNFIEEIDDWTSEESIRPCIYVFVNAWTSLGGSQFINGKGSGNYEDYLVHELLPALKKQLLDNNYQALDFILLGGSSGGYGALHLCSKFPEIFPHCLAIAPDCDFEISLKPEIYKAFYDIHNLGGVAETIEKIKLLQLDPRKKSFHTIVNVLAMASCYSDVNHEGVPELPIDHSGHLNNELWEKWLKKDPLYFLEERAQNLNKLKTLFLSVGEFDQFLLQYGSRKIKENFDKQKIDYIYEEFKGNHFDLGTRRKKALSQI